MLSNLHPVFQQALMPFIPDPRHAMTMQKNDVRVEDFAQEMLDLLVAIVIEGDGDKAEELRMEAFELTQRAEGRK